MGRILAIDYGKKRSGIAVTDELKIIATGLSTVPTLELLNFLKDYLRRERVECMVVGEPKQMDNTPSEASVIIEPFVKKLRNTFPDVRIARMDERFTSLLATRAIRESGVRKKVRQDKALIDTVSATLILQSFMEQEQNKYLK
ncbi:MAG: Holliday junction resolvase RuvX [Alphaproteobacteria bacterium]|nr:Holliday junction resolvase RuvX [Alphaproteobacteria bacterium]